MEFALTSSDSRGTASPAAARLWRVIPWLLVAALVALSAWLLVVPIEALFVRIPVNYDEGWNAFHAQRLMSGGPLYPPVASGITINYPPLSFYVVGALGKLIGDYVFAGRLLALISQAVVAINVAMIAKRLGTSGVFSVFAAIAFVLFIQIYFSDYVAMDDPQWFGHALQTSALALLVRDDISSSRRRLMAVVLLLLIGGLAKHSLVSLPIAATLWIGFEHRRLLFTWMSYCAAGLLTVTLGFYAAYGWSFFDQVLANPRNFTGLTLLWMTENIGPRLLPFALFAFGGFFLAKSSPQVRLMGIYAVVSLLLATVLMSARGVIYNALFDFTIAAMPLAALLGQQAEQRLASRPWGRSALSLALAFPLLSVIPHAQEHYGGEIDRLAHQAQWQQLIDTIARAPAPLICQQLSLCYWAGRESSIETFNFAQRAVHDPALAELLARRISRGDFSLIQEDELAFDPGLALPKQDNDAIETAYRVVSTDPAVLLVPAARPAPKPTEGRPPATSLLRF